jgi:hypothetical protein
MTRAQPRSTPVERKACLSVLPPIRVERGREQETGVLFALQGLYQDYLEEGFDCARGASLHQTPPSEEP